MAPEWLQDVDFGDFGPPATTWPQNTTIWPASPRNAQNELPDGALVYGVCI